MKEASVYEIIDKYYQTIDDGDQYPDEFLAPEEERKSGIGKTLSQALNDGCSVDDSDGYFNALMLAVGSGDAPMVHFLIQHGANANSWPGMNDEPQLEGGNYYLDDIDIHIMDEGFARDKDIAYINGLCRTAMVLAKEAHLGPYKGFCLRIDEEGNVSASDVKVLF